MKVFLIALSLVALAIGVNVGGKPQALPSSVAQQYNSACLVGALTNCTLIR